MFENFLNGVNVQRMPSSLLLSILVGERKEWSHKEGSYPSHSAANSMSNLKTELEHIKHHIKYPANKTQVLAACNNMTDVPSIDKEFVTKSLTDNNYKGPEDVVRALLNKV
jgi:hypothetical protein